jgi:anti-anti-sigma factor
MERAESSHSIEGDLAPSFTVERRAEGTILSVHGEVDVASSPQLEAMIAETDPKGRLVVDLSGCTYLDSSVLTVFVRIYKARAERFALVIPLDARIRRLFTLTKLDEVLTVVPDRAAAFS